MAILRGLSSRLLTCGCLAGVYETYEGDVVTIVDARGPACKNPTHVDGKTLPSDASETVTQNRISAHDGR
jgi:hypothetical protein